MTDINTWDNNDRQRYWGAITTGKITYLGQ